MVQGLAFTVWDLKLALHPYDEVTVDTILPLWGIAREMIIHP